MESVELVRVERRLIAAVRRRTTVGKVPSVILPALDVVWRVVRGQGMKFGMNVAVYRSLGGDELEADFGVEVASEVASRFDDCGEVRFLETPSGMAAAMTHVGPYRGMRKTYEAISSWMREHGYLSAGAAVEVYGHWREDESRLETELYVLVAPR